MVDNYMIAKKYISNKIDKDFKSIIREYINYKFRLGVFYGYMLGSFLMFIFMLIINVVD